MDDSVPRDVVPRDVVPRDVVPRDVVPRDVVFSIAASGRTPRADVSFRVLTGPECAAGAEEQG